MIVTAYKTHKITKEDQDILKVVGKYIPVLKENSVVAITSKIVSICEGSLVEESHDKDKLIKENSQYFIPRDQNPYQVSLTITGNILIASAGIDESNGNGLLVLWPKNPQASANKIRNFLKQKFNLKKLGVIITDSKTTPLRWGVTAIAIAYSGIQPLKNYIGQPDIFGRDLHYTKMSVIDNLSCAAALVMGEGNEQSPIAVIQDIPNIEFVDADPTDEELQSLKITKNEDIYAPLLNSAPWKKGGKD